MCATRETAAVPATQHDREVPPKHECEVERSREKLETRPDCTDWSLPRAGLVTGTGRNPLPLQQHMDML